MIDDFAKLVPQEMLTTSGRVFYSGRKAFSSPSPLYVLGLNPGGDPIAQSSETVRWNMDKVLSQEPDHWSAYRDESWQNRPPGTWGMQPRVLHLMRQISMNPDTIPASNVIFVRSRREHSIRARFRELADACWPFHEAVIRQLQPRVVLCFGATAGQYVQQRLMATEPIGVFTERNNRKWSSRSFRGMGDIVVIAATHPGIADWTTPSADPSSLVLNALQDSHTTFSL